MTQRNVILVAVVAAIAAMGSFYMLALKPKREELTKLDAAITKQETARDQANAQVAGYEKAKQSYKANYAKVVELGKAVPADDDVRSLLVQLEDTAKRDDVDFRLISVGSGSEGSGGAGATAEPGTTPLAPGVESLPGSDIGVLPFSFGFSGKYFSLTDFFSKVNRFVRVHNSGTDATGRLILLTSFSLKPDQSGFPKLSAEVGASTYVTPPTVAPASAGANAAGAPTQPAGNSTPPTTTATATGAVR
jgi:Tfp pilus assembly protein PilO